MASSMNQVNRPQAGDHGIQLQHGILYLFVKRSSMNQVIWPLPGDHGIQLQPGIFVFVCNDKQHESVY